MIIIAKFALSGILTVMAISAIIYRIDQPEYAKRGHALMWAIIWIVIAIAVPFIP